MNSFSIASILSLWLAIAFAIPLSKEKEIAFGECNSTYPVQRNPVIVVNLAVIAGESTHISQEERCFLNCFLQKVDFLDANSNIRGARLLNYTIKELPEVAKYSNIFIGSVHQLNRINKGIEDKCLRAYVNYKGIMNQLMGIAYAEGLAQFTVAQHEIYDAVENGKPIDSKLGKNIKSILDLFDVMSKKEIRRIVSAESPSQQQASSIL